MTQRTRALKFSYERKPHFEPSEVDDYMDSMDSEVDEKDEKHKSIFYTVGRKEFQIK